MKRIYELIQEGHQFIVTIKHNQAMFQKAFDSELDAFKYMKRMKEIEGWNGRSRWRGR